MSNEISPFNNPKSYEDFYTPEERKRAEVLGRVGDLFAFLKKNDYKKYKVFQEQQKKFEEALSILRDCVEKEDDTFEIEANLHEVEMLLEKLIEEDKKQREFDKLYEDDHLDQYQK